MSKRLYGLDLLKTIAMVFIIGLHFNYRTGALSDFAFTDGRFYPVGISEAIFYVSVDCFVLITGYFGIAKGEASIKRLVSLVLVVWFYSWMGLAIGLAGGARPTLSQVIMCVLPFTAEHYWFIDVYLILSLLIPFINKVIAGIDRKHYRDILLVCLIGFSVLPSFAPFASEIFSLGGGANIVWFIVLYLIGGYLRLYSPFERVSNHRLSVCFIGLSLFTFFVKLAAQIAVAFAFPGKHIGGGQLYHHNSITVIAAALLLFTMMQRLNIGDKAGRKISATAACTSGIYLGHEHELFRTTFWQGLVSYLPTSPVLWVIAMIGVIICVFWFFLAIEAVRKKLFSVLKIGGMENKIADFIERRGLMV